MKRSRASPLIFSFVMNANSVHCPCSLIRIALVVLINNLFLFLT
jgi:hypothetical protein